MDEKVNARTQTRTHMTHTHAHMPTHTHQIYTPDMKKCTLFGDTTCLKSNDALALVYRFVCVRMCVCMRVSVSTCVSASVYMRTCVCMRVRAFAFLTAMRSCVGPACSRRRAGSCRRLSCQCNFSRSECSSRHCHLVPVPVCFCENA